MIRDNSKPVTFYEKLQTVVDEMYKEANAAKALHESRPDKENNIMPLAFGEAHGFSTGVKKYADELQGILVKLKLESEKRIPIEGNMSFDDQTKALMQRFFY